MALLALLGIFALLTLIGTVGHRRLHPGVPLEVAAASVWPAALGLATALANDVVGLSFVVVVASDDLIKGILRQYVLPSGSIDALLIAIVVGDLALTIIAAGRHRTAIAGETRRRRSR